MAHRIFTRRRARPPAFSPVRLRKRKDGWTPGVQCAFLVALYRLGSVARAAKAVGRSRVSAYRLRAKAGAESFASAWDHVLAGPSPRGEPRPRRRQATDWRKFTLQDLQWRIEMGLLRPVLYRGKLCAITRKPDDSALLRLLRRLDAKINDSSGTGS